MYVFILLFALFLFIKANDENQNFKNRQKDPMLDICIQLLEEERPLLAMVRNLLQNNSTFTQLGQCHSEKANQTLIWSKLKPIWNKFTETIDKDDEWLDEKELCRLFTNKLNPLYCRFKKDDEKCESKLVGSVYAFWYLYAQTALNITSLESCSTLPHSLMKMKGNPLNPKLYGPNFDLKSEKIVTGDVCMSHNLLWRIGKDKRTKSTSEQKRLFGIGLRQFQHFGSSIYDF